MSVLTGVVLNCDNDVSSSAWMTMILLMLDWCLCVMGDSYDCNHDNEQSHGKNSNGLLILVWRLHVNDDRHGRDSNNG